MEQPKEVAALRLNQVNWRGSLAAAEALESGKSLEEALAIGKATPDDAEKVAPDPDDETEPAPPAPVLAADDRALWRRYMSARLNARRDPNLLSDDELQDAALIVDESFVSAAIWKNRVTS